MGTSPGDGVNTNHGNGTPELDGVTSDADSDLRSQFRSDNPPTVDFTRVKEVRDLDVGWISSQGANIDAAGKYENEMKAAGQPVDQDKLVEVLGGDKVHYRLTTLENGLKFVDIVRDTDGEQIYSDTEYHGLISCNCGAIHDSPAVSTPDHVRGTDIGDGFQLNMTVSGHSDTKGYASTSTYAEKEYKADGADIKVFYDVEPTTSNGSGHLFLKYEGRELEDRTHEVNVVGKGIENRTESVTSKLVTVEFRGEPDKNTSAEVTVAINLADSTFQTQWDQVTFKFGHNGQLEEIVGISNSDKPNPEWTDSNLLQAMKKGLNDWYRYSASDPEAKIISEAVFGKDVTDSSFASGVSLDAVLQTAIKGEKLQMDAELNFS